MSSLYIPKDYRLCWTIALEEAIGKIGSIFQNNLAFELNLKRVCPLFVLEGEGGQ